MTGWGLPVEPSQKKQVWTNAICPKCGYSWETRSTRPYLCCPHCYRQTPRERVIKIVQSDKGLAPLAVKPQGGMPW